MARLEMIRNWKESLLSAEIFLVAEWEQKQWWGEINRGAVPVAGGKEQGLENI